MERKEALEVVRKNMPTDRSLPVYEALQTLIPELRESEDERLRKDLIAFLIDMKDGNVGCFPSQSLYQRWIALLEKQKEQQPVMIQWTGKNLKEVIDFTGKSPKFGEWFKSWDEFEEYVHTHNDILKLFCGDGSHYEVPIGAWIFKTPDGYNIPSRFRFIQKPAEWNYPYGVNETADRLFAIAECLEMDGDCLFNGYSGTECGKFLRELARKQVECKPAERSDEDEKWSDRDEEILEFVLGLLDNLVWRRDWEISQAECSEWLVKSLQPHWKPCEEQIHAIIEALKYLPNNKDEWRVLNNLADVFRKLM